MVGEIYLIWEIPINFATVADPEPAEIDPGVA